MTVKVCMYNEEGPGYFDLPEDEGERAEAIAELEAEGWQDTPVDSSEGGSDDEPDYTKLKKAELEALCNERGLDIPEGAKKADLIGLLEADDNE